MRDYTLGVRLLMGGLLATTTVLGLPVFHYVTAVMIALLVRHGKGEGALLAPLGGHRPFSAAVDAGGNGTA